MNGDEIQTTDHLELRDYLRVIRERFWVLPTAVIVVVGVALAVSLTAIPQYRASARLLYEGYKLQQAVSGVQSLSLESDDQQLRTAAVLVKLVPVAEGVAEALNSPRSVPELLDMVTADAREGENVLDIFAEGPNAQECVDVANEFAAQFMLARQEADRAKVRAASNVVEDQLRSLSREELDSEYGQAIQQKVDDLRMLESMQTGGFQLVQPATVPDNPYTPRPVRNGVLALVVGIVLGLGLAFLLDYLDKRVKDEKALEKWLGAPVLTKVPVVGGRRRRGADGRRLKEAIGFNKRPALLEAFRTLRSNLEFFSVEKQQAIWLVTSSVPEEGKTTTTVNLAISLALSGKRVVVLEADLRKPMLHEYFSVAQTPGLSNVLAGTKRLEEALQFVKADEFMPPESRRRPGEERPGLLQRNIYTVSSGPLPPNPAELLTSPRMGKVIQDLAGMCDCLLIDTPPVLAVADAVALARHADGVVVVARLGSTTSEQIGEVREIFARAEIRVVGSVAIAAKKSPAYRRRRGYGYGYGYGYGSVPANLSVDE